MPQRIYTHSGITMEFPKTPQEYIEDFAKYGKDETVRREMQHWVNIGYASIVPTPDMPRELDRHTMQDWLHNFMVEEDYTLYVSVNKATREVQMDYSPTVLSPNEQGVARDYDLRQLGYVRIEGWYEDTEVFYTWVVRMR